jgi:hypothetical protein
MPKLTQELLQLKNPRNPEVPMTFSYSKEAHIELNLDMEDDNNKINDNNCHYWAGAIAKGLIHLTHGEVAQFLDVVGTATFGFFKIKLKGIIYRYFMALSNTPQG